MLTRLVIVCVGDEIMQDVKCKLGELIPTFRLLSAKRKRFGEIENGRLFFIC